MNLFRLNVWHGYFKELGKTITMPYHLKTLTLAWFVAATALLSSCARSINFNKSVIVPAATGKVKIKEDKNSNFSLNVKISNLAPASRLQPPKDHYVLWMESNNNTTKNLGRLNSSKPIFGKAYSAKLKTVTTYQPSRFFVTAENENELRYPQGQEVLTTDAIH